MFTRNLSLLLTTALIGGAVHADDAATSFSEAATDADINLVFLSVMTDGENLDRKSVV